ncbi:MAG: hypothetical protein WCO67_15800, partial [Betaproteobacteria bacterium]
KKACAVLVGRKAGSAAKKLLPEIARATGGKFHKGECIFEKNVHTFVLDQVPAGLARKLGTALLAETGTKYKVRVRSTDGSVDLDSETDTDPDEKIHDAPPMPKAEAKPTAAPVAKSEEFVKFTNRLKTLLPQIKAKAHVQAGAGTPQAKGLNVVASEAGVFATKSDFTKANQLLDLVESLVKADDAKAEFDKKFPPLKTRADTAKSGSATVPGTTAPLKAMADALKAVTDKQTAKDYVTAVGLLTDLEGKIDAVEKLAAAAKAAKTDFDKRFPAIEKRAQKAQAADAGLAGITGPLKALGDALKAVTDKQAAKDYVAAVGLLADLNTKITAVENLVTTAEAAKKTVADELTRLDADLDKAIAFLTPTPALKTSFDTFYAALKAVYAARDGKDYVKAANSLATLNTTLTSFLKAASDYDKAALPKATTAEKTVTDLLKTKKLAGKTNAEKLQLLRDLRGTAAAMTPEFRAAQREIYNTLNLDKNFIKEDKKKRKEIIKTLVPGKTEKAEFKEVRKNWGKKTEAQKIATIKKAIDAQSKVLGIPSPPIVPVNEPGKDGLITNGYFNPNDGKIYINFDAESSVHDFEKAIDLAFHENSHNYQNELGKKLEAGTLPKTDPVYEETLLFQANQGPQAYVDGAEDFPVYQKQPLEEHAHLNGPKTAKALLKAIK